MKLQDKFAISAARENLKAFAIAMQPEFMFSWHNRLICQKLMEVESGKIKHLMINVPPRGGKLIANHTPILTEKGWKKHGELKVGDVVYNQYGKPIKVLAVSSEDKADYKMVFTNNETIYCHGGHEWVVEDRWNYNRQKITETNKLAEMQLNEVCGHKQRYRFFVPNIEALHFSRKSLPLDPYVFGLWLGDGSASKPCITYHKKDKVVIDEVVRRGHVINRTYIHKQTGILTTYFDYAKKGQRGKLSRALKDMNVLNNKHIPSIYLSSSIEQRLDLLAGLIDSDGDVDCSSRVSFSNTNKKLIEAVYQLVLSLGFRPYILKKQPRVSTSGVNGKKVVYIIRFNPTIDIPTVIHRKKIKRFIKQRRVGIKKVEYDPQGYVGRCIQVDSEDGVYLVGEKLVPTHNSMLSSQLFPAWFLGRNPNKHVICATYGQELADDFGRKVRNMLREQEYRITFPESNLAEDSASIRKFSLKSGGSYYAVGAGGALSGKGASVLILDDTLRNRADANSELIRRNIIDWYKSTAYTRLEPSGSVIILNTRWHEEDLCGYLLKTEPEKWEVVNIPALNEKQESYWPERWPESRLKDVKDSIGSYEWSALYQQNPTPRDGGMFSYHWFEVVKHSPSIGKRIRYWDRASTIPRNGNDPDYTVGLLVSKTENNVLYVEDMVRIRESSFNVQAAIKNTAVRDGFEVEVVLEQDPGQAGKSEIDYLIRQLSGFITRANKVTKDKVTRAANASAQAEAGNIKLLRGAWNKDFLEEVCNFPFGAHDDIVDCLSESVNILTRQGLNYKALTKL